MSSDINSGIDKLYSNTQGLKVYLQAIEDGIKTSNSKLKSIDTNVNTIMTFVNTIKVYMSQVINNLNFIYEKLEHIFDVLQPWKNQYFDKYNTDTNMGWDNFWGTFATVSLHDFIVNTFDELYNKVQNQVNPISEDNVDKFNNVINGYYEDTFIGSLRELGTEAVPQIVDSLDGSSATWTFKTIAVKNSYFSIPSHTITLDMSWYAQYKSYGDTILSGFMWLAYIWLLFKRAPSIIHGGAMVTDNLLKLDDSQINSDYSASNSTFSNVGVNDITSDSEKNGIIENDDYRNESILMNAGKE